MPVLGGLSLAARSVILTPESVEALQNMPAPAPHAPNADEVLHPYDFSDEDVGFPQTLARLRSPDTIPPLAGGVATGTDPWFMGGLDPFSSLPHRDGEPIPQKLLIFHCTIRSFPTRLLSA